MTSTATIRVPVDTRDDLAGLARRRGESLSSYLTEMARRARREEILAGVRAEVAADEANPAAAAEYALWEETADDGLD